jgi:type I restriction enzyme S subunit
MEYWDKAILLENLVKDGIISLDRGRVISSIDLMKYPGDFPVYSSSAQRNGYFGSFDLYDFDEELITWSVDGGGYFFYRPKHKFSVTNVSGIMRVTKANKYDYKFLYYLLAYQHKNQIFDYVDKAHPSVIKKRYFIPEIGITEQTQIATIISKVDEAIAQTEQLIAKYSRIKTGLMQDLLTKGFDENGNIRTELTHEFKDSPLGRIPKEWECLTIKEIAERLRSGVTPKGGSDVYEKEGVLLIRSQNVYSYGFKLEDVAYINEEINNRMLGSQLKEFDVLLNITGASIGRATYVPEGFPRANVNQHVCAIRLKKADVNNAIFLSSYLNSINGQNQIYQNIAGSNREGINYTQIKEINVPFFNNDFELEKFSEMVTKSNERINSEIKTLSKLQSLKTGLMQDLLSGKVRVNNLMKEKQN